MIHNLKTWPKYFQPIKDGVKTFDVRMNDRNFQVGDYLHLQEWDPNIQKYTGRDLLFVKVVYLLTEFSGLAWGWCVMGIELE